MIPDLVSIIVPVRDRPASLVEAVESALAQTYRPLEVVIVDDGSTDETPEVAGRLAAANPTEVRVLRRPNGGPGLARETGRNEARGEYLQYLDSDDLILPRKLEVQVAALRAHRDCAIAYGMCREVDAGGVECMPALRPSNLPIESMFPTFLACRWWNTLIPLYRAELGARIGPWSDLRIEEDWEYDARAGALGPRLTFVPEILGVVRELPGSRLSRGSALDPARLADRARAHLSIARSAERHPDGVRPSPERARMARELFLLARQCGAARLGAESRALFLAAREASTPQRARGIDFMLYKVLAGAFGWSAAGRLSLLADRLRG